MPKPVQLELYPRKQPSSEQRRAWIRSRLEGFEHRQRAREERRRQQVQRRKVQIEGDGEVETQASIEDIT